MPKPGINFDTVRAIAREFPDLQEGLTYGAPSIKLGDRLVVCIPSHKSAESGSLAVRTDFEPRATLLADDPATYYLTPHYVNHPIVLVRMARLHPDQLRGLIADGRQFVLNHAQNRRQQARRSKETGRDPRR